MARAAGRKAPPQKKTVEDDQKYLCPYCLKEKKKTEFYMSSDPFVLTGITTMCKDCAKKIALNWDERRQEFGTCTKASVQEALIRLDKPFLNKIWDSSYLEWANQDGQVRKTTIWDAYIKNIGMVQYRGMRWQDSDIFDVYVEKAKKTAKIEIGKENRSSNITAEDVEEAYKTNRKDAVRMIGYDPFANYPVEEDKPVLYAQLISFIDEETKNDGMKMNAVIQIVKAFNQIQKINDAIDELSSDVMSLNNNNGTIKQHADTISKLLSGANALAKDNGINNIVLAPGNWFEKIPIELLETPYSKIDYKAVRNNILDSLKTILIGKSAAKTLSCNDMSKVQRLFERSRAISG